MSHQYWFVFQNLPLLRIYSIIYLALTLIVYVRSVPNQLTSLTIWHYTTIVIRCTILLMWTYTLKLILHNHNSHFINHSNLKWNPYSLIFILESAHLVREKGFWVNTTSWIILPSELGHYRCNRRVLTLNQNLLSNAQNLLHKPYIYKQHFEHPGLHCARWYNSLPLKIFRPRIFSFL